MIRIFLDPIALGLNLFFIAKVESDEFLKVIILSLVVGFVNFLLALLLGEKLGIFVLLPMAVIDGFIITRFFSMELSRAARVVGSYLGYIILLGIVLEFLLKK
ncbi:MAG: hypothetical protein ACYS8W_20070 [Planctomycetota bacterium]|jgi:hypothetical protein